MDDTKLAAGNPAHLALADRYGAHAGERYELQVLADRHGEDAVLNWLRAGVPTRRLDVSVLSDLLAAGVTEQRFRWLVSRSVIAALCYQRSGTSDAHLAEQRRREEL